MRIVQLANFVTPTSGGIRTALAQLGSGYRRAGHERHLVIPGDDAARHDDDAGTTWTLPGVRLPHSGGYRVLLGTGRVRRLLDRLRPDRIEVSDRFTLVWVAGWARARGIPSIAFVHEHLPSNLATWLPSPWLARAAAARADTRLEAAFDVVVCASAFTASSFRSVVVVPLGVHLDDFHPRRRPHRTHGPVRLVLCSRLSAEKRVELAFETAAVLRARNVDVALDVLGDGPLRRSLERRFGGPHVRFRGHVAGRHEVAAALARADVLIAPNPVEAFGLAALEALACGTPVVACGGGTADLVRGAGDSAAGLVAAATPTAQAEAVVGLLDRPAAARTVAARTLAERYPWSRTVDRMLALHADLGPDRRRSSSSLAA